MKSKITLLLVTIVIGLVMLGCDLNYQWDVSVGEKESNDETLKGLELTREEMIKVIYELDKQIGNLEYRIYRLEEKVQSHVDSLYGIHHQHSPD